jgi:hypothetical protein
MMDAQRNRSWAGHVQAWLTRLLPAALGAALVLATPLEARAECDASGVCVEGATWSSDSELSDKARRKEAKKNRKRKDVSLSVLVEGGRGSLFIDGVWVSEAPATAIPVKPGRHDLQVRDGARVLAKGILKIPKNGGEVSVQVPHG